MKQTYEELLKGKISPKNNYVSTTAKQIDVKISGKESRSK